MIKKWFGKAVMDKPPYNLDKRTKELAQRDVNYFFNLL